MGKVETWFYGLLAAAIGAAANGITCVVVAPETFNFQAGTEKLLAVMGANALVAIAMYLKHSPLPPINGGDKNGGVS